MVMEIIKLLQGLLGLIVAILALIGAIFSTIKLINEKKKIKEKPKEIKRKIPKKYVVISIILLILSIGIFSMRFFIEPLPINAQLTVNAWNALNNNNYELAIIKAGECINKFENQAVREQNNLKDSPELPIGKVSESEKQSIFSHGVLNDVATSYFIKGQALEKLNRINEAKEAYQRAKNFTYARTWDPQGWFWSPAEASIDRLSVLQ